MLPRKAERSSFQLSSWMVSVQICECLRAHLIIPFRWFISSLFGFRVSVQLEYGSPSLSLSLSLSPVLDADSFHYVPIQKKTTHQWCTAFLFFFTFDFSLSRSRSQHFFPLSVLQLQTHTQTLTPCAQSIISLYASSTYILFSVGCQRARSPTDDARHCRCVCLYII